MTPIWWPVWTSTRISTWQFLFQPSVLQLNFLYPSKFATTVFNHFVRPMHWPQKNSPISFSTAHAFVQVLQFCTWQAFAWIHVCCRCHRLSGVEGTYIIFINYDFFQRGSNRAISRIMKNGPVNPRYQSTMSLSTKWFLRNGDLLKEEFIRDPQTFLRVLALRPRHIFKIPCAQNEILLTLVVARIFLKNKWFPRGAREKVATTPFHCKPEAHKKKNPKHLNACWIQDTVPQWCIRKVCAKKS